MEELKRFLVIGDYAEVVYATNEIEAKEKYIKVSKVLNRVENLEKIKVEEKPFK